MTARSDVWQCMRKGLSYGECGNLVASTLEIAPARDPWTPRQLETLLALRWEYERPTTKPTWRGLRRTTGPRA